MQMEQTLDGLAIQAAEAERRRTLWRTISNFVRRKPLGAFGGLIVVVFVVMAVFANLLAPYSFRETHLISALKPPNREFLLGTDPLGRDMLSRLVHGARVSMYVGLGVVVLSLAVSLTIGLSSGYVGGAYDLMVQRLVDTWMAFPGLVILLTVMALVGPGLFNVIIVLGIGTGISTSRIVRGATMEVRQNLYVEAARSLGAGHLRVMLQYLLPNIMAPLIILVTLTFGNAILVEAALSFLGLGVPPPAPSRGGRLSGDARTYMFDAPWLALWPGVFITAAVFGFNTLGDALRDILDPRLRGRGA
ncbi:MAG: ABC transporter permease [Dehalococcoidia bacterium]